MIQHNTENKINLQGFDTTDFGIELNESMFKMLTSKIYQDPIKAVIREYSTNANDATKEAGSTAPIEVHLPTETELNYSVRDYGTGLSKEQLETLFCTFGASTKRDSNNYNGTFGIGRMAGLAYADSFTVTSFFNNEQLDYLITTTEGRPTAVFMGSSSTTEPNGLLVSVPVDPSDIHEFTKTATNIFKYFSHKPNLNLDLNISPSITTGCDEWFIDESLRSSWNNYILMSDVLYEIPSNLNIDEQGFNKLVMRADTGAVSINPGRESLNLDKSTIAYINSKFLSVVDSYADVIEEAIETCSTPLEKFNTLTILLNQAPRSVKKACDVATLLSDFPLPVSSDRYSSIQVTQQPTDVNLKVYYTYYKHPRSFDKENLNADKFSKPAIIIDITKGAQGLYEQLDEQHLILARPAGVKMDKFVLEAKTFLDQIGHTDYQLASDIYTPLSHTSIKTVRDEGIYVSDLSGTSISQSVKAIPEKLYIYVPVSGTSHTLDYGLITAMTTAYQYLPDPPALVGIPKKYLAAAESNPNFTLATDYIKQALSSITFITKHHEYTSNYISTYPSTLEGIPHDTYRHYLAHQSAKAFESSDTCQLISSKKLELITPHFSVTHYHYYYTVSTWKSLCTKYPLLENLTEWGTRSERANNLTYYLQMEHSLAKLRETT